MVTRRLKRRQTRRLTGGRRNRKRVTRKHIRGGINFNPRNWFRRGSANLYTQPQSYPAPQIVTGARSSGLEGHNYTDPGVYRENEEYRAQQQAPVKEMYDERQGRYTEQDEEDRRNYFAMMG